LQASPIETDETSGPGAAVGGRPGSGRRRGGPLRSLRNAPLRPATAVVTLYLAATAIPLAAGGVGGFRGLVLFAHLAVLVTVAWTDLRVGAGKAGRGTRLFADLHVLLLLPLLYAELPFLMEGMPGPVVFRDPLVQAAEGALFGFQPAWELAGAAPLPWLSEVLHLAYLLYYPIIYVPPLLLYWSVVQNGPPGRPGTVTRPRASAEFEEAACALALSMAMCFVVFVVWPVQGPRYLAAPEGVPDGFFRVITLRILEGGSSRGAAFPSSHVAIAVTQTLVMLRFRRPFGVLLGVVTVLLALGAVYGGFHYGIDALAGAVFGAAAAGLARLVFRPGPRVAPGFTPVRGGA